MNKRILVVDDEEIQANIIFNILKNEGYSVVKEYSAEGALKMALKNNFSAMLVDLKMPGIGGLGLLKKAKEKEMSSNIIIMTAYGTIETAVEALKNGAFDYITKPFSKDELLIIIEKAVKAFNLYNENIHLKEELKNIYEDKQLVGISRDIKRVYELIEKVSKNNTVNILITGESGTGKELIAREIHLRSPRSDMPFIGVNCSAIPESLIESELFGYKKGSFTGAVSNRDGMFKRANGGTIFLDEITEMPLNMQVKLLRVIQEREITPIGGDDPISIDVSIISATNRNIENMVKRGEFRDDLYYRLNVVPIHISPLRERKEDIPVLINYIINKLNKKLNRNVNSLPDDVLIKLKEYNYPGNVRELENILERAFILAGGDNISSKYFPMLNSFSYEDDKFKLEISSLKEISRDAKRKAEKKAIINILNKTEWNRVKAAKLLKVNYKTLRKKIKELSIIPIFNEERKIQ